VAVDEASGVSQEKRRRRTLAEKRSIVEQAMQPGAKVAEIARQHGINDNLIFNWRKLYLGGRLGAVSVQCGRLLPVKVADGSQVAPLLASDGGTISIQLSKARIRIEGRADANTLAMVLERLLR
jgi:transposase